MNRLQLLPDARPLKQKDAVYSVSREALDSYALACLQAALTVEKHEPNMIFCPLRGAYPPTRIVLELLGDKYKGAVEWVPTSNFVKGREDLILDAAIKYGRTRTVEMGPGHVLSIDTAITGSSSRNQRSLLKKIIPKAMQLLRTPAGATLEMTLVRLWEGRAGEFKGYLENAYTVRSKNGYNLNIRDYNIGVEDLISEDKPNLLGIDYPNRVDKQRYSPYLAQVMARNPISIVQAGQGQSYHPTGDETTADLFVRLVVENARKLKAQQK